MPLESRLASDLGSNPKYLKYQISTVDSSQQEKPKASSQLKLPEKLPKFDRNFLSPKAKLPPPNFDMPF